MELDVYRRFNLPLLFWTRVGNDPREWKGPHEKGWNDPSRIYDLARFNPDIHNLGVFTGRAIGPGKHLIDVDYDKPNASFAKAFFPPSRFAVTRPGKPISHVFYTSPMPLDGKVEYLSLRDDKPYVELRGTKFQTMLPPSLHTPPDVRVTLLDAEEVGHVDLSVLERAAFDYAVASLVAEGFPGGLHHDLRLALAGFLLKRQYDASRLVTLLQTICAHQVASGIPDMSQYDLDDAREVVESTVLRLKRQEKVVGRAVLDAVNAAFVKRLQSWLPRSVGPIGVDDFYAYMPMHTYLFIPSREFWPASSVNARLGSIPAGVDDGGDETTMPANIWLDQNRPVEQLTWAPGLPMHVTDRLVSDGGWIVRPGCSCVNVYRPPQITLGDATQATPWLKLLQFVYPNDADHIVAWLAHRVQRPHEKINHALVLGGAPGIGKDSLLEPVKSAIGPWNFCEVSPKHMLGTFNGFAKSVILRISEVRDLGELTRYDFYEHMKVYAAAPPDVLRVNEKNLREHAVFNVCGPLYTTNHETDSMYLPPDDRRHYVAWSTKTAADFGLISKTYWTTLYNWYERQDGRRHVAAYLASYNLSTFDPKAPPPKTEAFWAIVDANRSAEDAELADLLDACANPQALTVRLLIEKCPATMFDLASWLADRKNARVIPHRMKTAGYVPHRNAAAKDGLWKIGIKRHAVYVRQELTAKDRQAAAEKLTK